MLVVPRVFKFLLFLLLQKFTGAINLVQRWRKTNAGDLWGEGKKNSNGAIALVLLLPASCLTGMIFYKAYLL